MKKNSGISKTAVVNLLKAKGLSLKRVNLKDGTRAWMVSDGKLYRSLRDIARVHAQHKKPSGINITVEENQTTEVKEKND